MISKSQLGIHSLFRVQIRETWVLQPDCQTGHKQKETEHIHTINSSIDQSGSSD